MKKYFIFYGEEYTDGQADIYYYNSLADVKKTLRRLEYKYDSYSGRWRNDKVRMWAQIISLKPAPIYGK